MKYVYILTSTKEDYYYEQCLMSIFSLRHYMPDADCVLLTDNRTFSTFNGKREIIKTYFNTIIQVTFPDDTNNTVRSRVLKTTLPEHIKSDFLFIDCDTIICDSLKDIENIDFPIGAVLDGHCYIYEHKHQDYFLKREKKLGYTGTKKQKYHINSGVILFRNTQQSIDFFKKWHDLWSIGYSKKHEFHDQLAFNEAISQFNFSENLLDAEWNCQISQGGLEFLENAKIIHYFSSEISGKNYIPYYKLASKTLLQRIKEEGSIPDEIQKMILNPKFQFTKVHLINDRRIISIIQSPLIFSLAELKSHLPIIFYIQEHFFTVLRKIARRIRGKNY